MPHQAASKHGPDRVDIHVGRRLREMRLLRCLSQSALGKQLGVTFQQIQKYERGANRLSASMLWHAAEALNVPVSSFFEQFRPDEPIAEQVQPQSDEIALVRHFRRLPQRLQRTLSELAEVMAEPT
jgi:transcriptional regulator with XRE-family HTH domain